MTPILINLVGILAILLIAFLLSTGKRRISLRVVASAFALQALMAADASDPVAYKALVDDKMMLIFEACSFQDIPGQRVAKGELETALESERAVVRTKRREVTDLAQQLLEAQAAAAGEGKPVMKAEARS